MKLKTFYGLLFISFLALPVCGMEKKKKKSNLFKKITITKSEVIKDCNALLSLFDKTQTNTRYAIPAATAELCQNRIENFEKKLQQEKISKNELVQLRQNILETTSALQQSIEQNELAQKLKHLNTNTLQQEEVDKTKKRQIQINISPEQIARLQENPPVFQQPQSQDQPIPQERPKSVLFQTEAEHFDNDSANTELPYSLSTQTRIFSKKSCAHTRWKKGIAYLMGTGLFTTIGLYSWYKLSPDSWYKPVALGTSVLGSAVCSFYSFKNLRMSKIQ